MRGVTVGEHNACLFTKRMTHTCVCLDPGAYMSGLPGVLAGRPTQGSARYVERRDAGQVFGSDEVVREYAGAQGDLCGFDSHLKPRWIPL